jgi:hypothetical protein
VFARNGYVVVMPLRRGFGATGGEYAEDPGTCANPDYRKGGRRLRRMCWPPTTTRARCRMWTRGA